MAALTGLGHEVFHVSLAAEPRPFDLLHVFGSDTDAWHVLHHWRRNPAPLVVSAVAVVSPGAAERRDSWAPCSECGGTDRSARCRA